MGSNSVYFLAPDCLVWTFFNAATKYVRDIRAESSNIVLICGSVGVCFRRRNSQVVWHYITGIFLCLHCVESLYTDLFFVLIDDKSNLHK